MYQMAENLSVNVPVDLLENSAVREKVFIFIHLNVLFKVFITVTMYDLS